MKKHSRGIILLILTALLVFSGCSASGAKYSYDNGVAEASMSKPMYAPNSDEYYDYEYRSLGYEMEREAVADAVFSKVSDSGAPGGADDTRKIIKYVTLSLETKEFDASIARLVSSVAAAGGYVESSYVSGNSLNDYGRNTVSSRYATYTLRVPAAGLDSYVNSLSEGFNVLSRQDTSSDITDSYFDSKARLQSLITQEERLLAMLVNANELQYMLQLEDKLSEVRYQIENYNSTLQRYDKSVAMATISVSVQEVVEYQKIIDPPKSFGERMWNSFVESWEDFAEGFQDFAVGLIYALPTLIILAVIVLAVVFMIVRASKRSKKRKASGGDNQ